MSFSEKLQALRKANKMSQEKLADLLDVTIYASEENIQKLLDNYHASLEQEIQAEEQSEIESLRGQLDQVMEEKARLQEKNAELESKVVEYQDKLNSYKQNLESLLQE